MQVGRQAFISDDVHHIQVCISVFFQSYISILDEDNQNNNLDEDDDNVHDIDPALQARFTQAVSALQFLGFVKPSKRKTDHVQRLTWGGC